MLLFIAAWSVRLLFKQRDPIGSFIFQVRQYGDESSSFARIFFRAHLLDDPLVSLPKMTRDFMVRNEAPHAVLYQWCPRKSIRFLDSQGWFPTSQNTGSPKKGSFFGGVFAHFFCFKHGGKHRSPRSHRFPRCRCAYCSGEQQFWNQFLEASWTWYGWYGCWDFQALVWVIPDTKSCFGKESPPLWQETKLFFEDIYADEFNFRTWRLSKMVIAPGFVHLIILRYS